MVKKIIAKDIFMRNKCELSKHIDVGQIKFLKLGYTFGSVPFCGQKKKDMINYKIYIVNKGSLFVFLKENTGSRNVIFSKT